MTVTAPQRGGCSPILLSAPPPGLERRRRHRTHADNFHNHLLVLGHVVVGGFMMTDMVYHLSIWVHLAIWAPITVITALAVIQPIKGGVIGLQWALKMHGFGGHDDSAEFEQGHDPR